MGCSFSGLNALYDAVNGGGDVWINENRFRVVRQLGEGGFAFVFLVKEIVADASGGGLAKKVKDPSHISADGTYAVKKVLIQNKEQLELVREEIRVSSLFNHPNLLPLLDHAIISVKDGQGGARKHEAFLLFPVHLDGTLLDNSTSMKAKKESFSTADVLHIFRQLCDGLKHMHSLEPPYAHNDVKPGNVLLTRRKGQPLAILMDFGSACPSRKQIRSRQEALQLQEWTSEHCSAPFRAPELWDCPSHADIDERTDIWSLGCTLYAIMYGMSPFEYALGESGGSLQLAIMNAQIKWPNTGPKASYPEALHQFVTWMLQPQAAVRPRIGDIIIHVDKLIEKFTK
ncbi:hypothetical protein F2Q69_00045257 [Brassica cretica]|uniref:non-specific serine/threonine protein kinase n=1 Tax=Brassica cretica TaxID=69181 RepID=A0A8S9NFR5_BRACR|nr:hypothetical protein F2Q69_00045257 [Brassica cretica]